MMEVFSQTFRGTGTFGDGEVPGLGDVPVLGETERIVLGDAERKDRGGDADEGVPDLQQRSGVGWLT